MEEKKQQQGLNLKVVKDFEIFLSIPRKKKNQVCFFFFFNNMKMA